MFYSLCLINTFNSVRAISKFQFSRQTLIRNVKSSNSPFCKYFHVSLNHAVKVKSTRQSMQYAQADIFNVNTKVQNNVLLFKYEKTRYYRLIQLFTFGWIFGTSTLAYHTYTPKLKLLFSKDIHLSDLMKEHGFHIAFFFYSIILGPTLLAFVWFASQRIIKYIILHKGGTDVTLVTYHLFKKENVITLPINKVQPKFSRNKMKNYLALKIQGKRFYYLVDNEGVFLNESLFDNTIGTSKNW